MTRYYIQLQHKESQQWRDHLPVDSGGEGLTKIRELMINDRFNRYRLVEVRTLVMYPI